MQIVMVDTVSLAGALLDNPGKVQIPANGPAPAPPEAPPNADLNLLAQASEPWAPPLSRT